MNIVKHIAQELQCLSESVIDPEFKKPKKPKVKAPAKKKRTGLGKKFNLNLDKAAKDISKINAPAKKKANPAIQKPGGRNITGKKGKLGIKRKGRLPSKKIVNKLGNVQTVYYRPDSKSNSKYVDPKKLSTAELMVDYGDSFKRMLFRDHDPNGRQGWTRKKGEQNQSQGHEMTAKLDKLADDYGFSLDKFDQQQESFLKDRKGNVDAFMHDAQKVYGDLYKMDKKQPFEFIDHIFSSSKDKLSYRKVDQEYKDVVADGLYKAVAAQQKQRREKDAIAKAKAGDGAGNQQAAQKPAKAKAKTLNGLGKKNNSVAAKVDADAAKAKAEKPDVTPEKSAKPVAEKKSKTSANPDADKPNQSEIVEDPAVQKLISNFRGDFVKKRKRGKK